jgi:hypothetical protein
MQFAIGLRRLFRRDEVACADELHRHIGKGKTKDGANLRDLQTKVGNALEEECRSLHPRKYFPGVDVLPFLDEQALDFSALGRADFVLHFHGFDDQ